jgi:hypothetical protein
VGSKLGECPFRGQLIDTLPMRRRSTFKRSVLISASSSASSFSSSSRMRVVTVLTLPVIYRTSSLRPFLLLLTLMSQHRPCRQKNGSYQSPNLTLRLTKPVADL